MTISCHLYHVIYSSQFQLIFALYGLVYEVVGLEAFSLFFESTLISEIVRRCNSSYIRKVIAL